MTNSSATSAPTAATVLDADDPRAVLARAIATAGAVIDAVQPDQRALPTPCSDYDVRGMVAHLVSVLHRVTVIGGGGDIFTVSDRAELVADDSWRGQWNATAAEVQEAWSDHARLDATVQVPWTTMSGTSALAVYTNEITVHTWDLAVATGQHPAWDDSVLAVSLRSIHEELPDAERAALWAEVFAHLPADVPFEPPFADAVDVAADAPAIDRLVAWNGRRP
jgi:uncharacterized protein (TIGR03086 family)